MLVDPVIVSRPGDGGSPPGGACAISGSASVSEGPYAYCHNGQLYCIQAARDLAKAFGLLVTPAAERKVEEMVREVVQLRARVESSAAEFAAADAERKQLTAEVQSANRRADELAAELAETKTYAQVAAEFLGGSRNGRRS